MRSNQVERKRHIGNDIVNIVFIEGDLSEFSPSCIKSQFTRILFKEQIKSLTNIVVYGVVKEIGQSIVYLSVLQERNF